ncbi:hypothetical protein BB559_002955 [Furculomyces boomerangus]|uniref:PCI domain-containing protein n=1 Tax=Furculomyces boomerangus TaxID=61424 RepID=A0A2T9YQM1_9FUNG|nr:hypothetical protein BB559_002955 [Furculomyces boomerangus]
MLEDGLLKYVVFMDIISVCVKNNLVKNVIHPLISKLKEYSSQFGISYEEQLALFTACKSAVVGEKLENDVISIERIMLESILKVGSPESINMASEMIIRSVNLPGFFGFEDFINLSAIQALKQGDAKHTFVYSLLNTFVSGNYLTWKDFVATNKSSLEEANVDLESAELKIQMLSLASLGNRELGNKIPFSKVSEEMFGTSSLENELDIELIIIDTIRFGLINAKIDQIDHSITISRSTVRQFGMDEWKIIGKRFNEWRTSLNALLPVINNAKLIAQLSLSSAPAVVEITKKK